MKTTLFILLTVLLAACGSQVGPQGSVITSTDGALRDPESSVSENPTPYRSPYRSDYHESKDSHSGSAESETNQKPAKEQQTGEQEQSGKSHGDQRSGGAVKNPDMKKGQAPDSSDLEFKGQLSPTIYFQAFLVGDEKACPSSRRVPMYGERREVLLQVCPEHLRICTMEGSCQIRQDGITHSFNYLGSGKGGAIFIEISHEDCVYGFGVRSICLDPFFTVAADLRFFNPGDVIFLPVLVGVALPNGETHDGYLIVRDRGGGIIGPDRFDFFTGNMDWQHPENPFTKLKLNDKRQKFPYYRTRGELARKVLSRRTFPNLPPTWRN